jgi:hypothetical protein
MPCQSAALLFPASFFQHPILQGQLSHHLLQLLKLTPHLHHFLAVCLTLGIPYQALIPRFQEFLAPLAVKVGLDPFFPAQLGDRVFPPQSFQHDPHLLFRGVLLTRHPVDTPHRRFY